jgi:hypothetical protein
MQTVILALTVALGLSAAQPSGFDGKWAFEMNSPMGSVSATVELQAADGKLAGEFDMGGGRTWPIENGTVNGDVIEFTINRDGKMTYEMKAKLTGDKIVGAAAAMGTTVDWVMTRSK